MYLCGSNAFIRALMIYILNFTNPVFPLYYNWFLKKIPNFVLLINHQNLNEKI